MIGYLYAIRAAFIQQWKVFTTPAEAVTSILFVIAPIAVLAWIANLADQPEKLAYVSVGVFFMAIWTSTAFRMGFSLTSEFFMGTLDIALASRTPMMVIMLGKALAVVTTACFTGLVAFATISLISQELIDVADVGLLVVSVGVTMAALIAASFTLTPFTLLVQGRAGFFNGIIPFGVVFSGFLFPVSQLPAGLEVVAWFLPASWGMDAVIRSVDGGGSTWKVVGDWIAALAISGAYLSVTYYMFRKVEERIRLTGSLATF